MIPAAWVGRGMGKTEMGIKECSYHDEKIKWKIKAMTFLYTSNKQLKDIQLEKILSIISSNKD